MSTPTLRMGIIGCGFVTVRGHVPALRLLTAMRVEAVADPVDSRRREAQEALGLPDSAAYASYRAMLESGRLDYVLVAVPPGARGSILQDCLSAGIHVLCEKPLALRPQEARALIDQALAANLRFGMVHNYLFYPEYIAVRDRIAAGDLGQVRHVGLQFMGVPDYPGHPEYRPLWRHDASEAGGGILMDMIHVLYVAEYLAGDRIRAVGAVIDNLAYADGDVEDLALLQLHFERSYATIALGWGHGPGGIEVTGSDGRMLVYYRDHQTGPFAEVAEVEVVTPRGIERSQPGWTSPTLTTFQELHKDFASAVSEGGWPIAPAESGLRALETALASYASALTGRVIELPLHPADPLHARGWEGLKELPAWDSSSLLRRRLFGLGTGARPVA
ncbi:MAG: Gfo/Idh/MocA family oxidoreductase [Anaerolineales bacterium]